MNTQIHKNTKTDTALADQLSTTSFLFKFLFFLWNHGCKKPESRFSSKNFLFFDSVALALHCMAVFPNIYQSWIHFKI